MIYSKTKGIEVNGRTGHDGSNCSEVAKQSAEALKSPKVCMI